MPLVTVTLKALSKLVIKGLDDTLLDTLPVVIAVLACRLITAVSSSIVPLTSKSTFALYAFKSTP